VIRALSQRLIDRLPERWRPSYRYFPGWTARYGDSVFEWQRVLTWGRLSLILRRQR
jgi:hypothetical protein